MKKKRQAVAVEAEFDEFDEFKEKHKLGTGIPVTPIRPSRPTQRLDPAHLQRLMENEPQQSCQRQGVCCTRIMLPHSPREIRESYNAWIRLFKEKGAHTLVMTADTEMKRADHLFGEIELIYPMLAGRCLGKLYLGWSGEGDLKRMYRVSKPAAHAAHLAVTIGAKARADMEPRYVYGPCKHFAWKATANAIHGECTIHAIRPHMCREYPNYGSPLGPNMGMFKNCGYNVDADYGLSMEDFNKPLDQLEDNEV